MNPRAKVNCLTIVAESVLEQRLVESLRRVGARGWTITTAHGKGPRNRRVSDLEGGNIRIEVLASDETTRLMWEVLESDYFPQYAVIAWEQEVVVARRDLF